MFFCTLIGTILSAAITFIVEMDDEDASKLKLDIKLIAVVCVVSV